MLAWHLLETGKMPSEVNVLDLMGWLKLVADKLRPMTPLQTV